ncbi:hypothetical protein AAG570_012649 [Ranatra chinensis]|uniref:PX domain-containing protein kinase-like protein n=1 Tax=Ranatra chinensis TaxID=642074 RepID=A0ABD0YEG2_9HEMI
MSIFERIASRKVYLDDTQPLNCTIINSEITQGHTEYVIRVQRGPLPENSWFVYKRYNDFIGLHQSLQGSGLHLPLPPKRLIGNFDREFIAERKIGLQKYLDIILQNHILSSHLAVKRFLDPDNYGASYQGLGLSQICIALRGELNIEVIKHLDVGWRLRKQHFLVHMKTEVKRELILSWVPFGPDKNLEEKQIQSVLKSLCTLQHVNIAPIEAGGVSEGGGWVIRNLYKNGTLLDYISGVKTPHTTSALRKYSNYKARKPLSVVQVVDITCQILQGLSYLHHKGVPYGHLHLGNVLLIDGTVKLLDIENILFGLPCYYRNYLTEHKQLSSMQAVDIYCLGLVMYEMLFCEPFNNSSCEAMPPDCPHILSKYFTKHISVHYFLV